MIPGLPKHIMQFAQNGTAEIECWKCGAWITHAGDGENGPFAAFAEEHLTCAGVSREIMKIG